MNRGLPTIREHKPEIIEALQRTGNDQSGTRTFYRWLIRFLDRDPLEVTCSPEAGRAEVESWYPEACGAELVLNPPGDALPALSDAKEAAILSWLEDVGEIDPLTIGEVIGGCETSAEVRRYFSGRD